MVKTILIFILLVSSIWVGTQLHHEPGYIMVSMNHWTIETTLWVGIVFLILVFVLLYLMLAFCTWIKNLSTSIEQWRRKRRINVSQSKAQQGVLEFCEGNWQSSLKNLMNALPNADVPLFNYLLAAHAAQAMGNNQQRDALLQEATHKIPDAKVAIAIHKTELQLASHQEKQACEQLERLRETMPYHPYILTLLAKGYEKLQNWQQLTCLLPSLKKAKVFPLAEHEAFESRVFLQALKALMQSADRQSVRTFFLLLPKNLAQSPDFISQYARFLLTKEDGDAEALLRKGLQKTWDDTLIRLYGEIDSLENLGMRIDFAQALLKKHSDSAALHQCLGRLNQLQRTWGSAQFHLEESIKRNPNPATWMQLGALFEAIGETKKACAAYKEGLRLHCLAADC